jgi:hypothetical protein
MERRLGFQAKKNFLAFYPWIPVDSRHVATGDLIGGRAGGRPLAG